MSKNGKYSNIVALALEDARESRIVYGKESMPITGRWYYTATKWLKIISFASVLVLSLMAVIAFWLEMIGLPVTDITQSAITELRYAAIFISVILAVITFGFVLTFIKKNDEPKTEVNIIGSVLMLFACAVCAVYFYWIMKGSDTFYDGGESAYIWRHLVPNAVLAVSAVANSLMAHFEKTGNNLRYEMIVGEAYDAFRESKQDESYSAEEWEEFLSSYTRPAKAYPLVNKRKRKGSEKEEIPIDKKRV